MMPDNFICGKCGKVAKTKQALERHAAYHEDDRPFSCEVCLQRFKNSDDRGKHYRRLKRDGKFSIACTVCHKHFKTDEILQKHVEMLGCNISADTEKDNGHTGENVKEGSAINLKEENVNGECIITCTCKVCETGFTNTSALKKHYKEVHNDNKRQVCIQCGQTLSSKDSLARHFSIFHQSSFPYACDFCDQKFKIKESLCRHVKFVHEDGGYQCHECHRVFSQPVNLRKHSAIHSTLKEFACKSCGREFRWKQALQKHELLHGTQTFSNISKDSHMPAKDTATTSEDIERKIADKDDTLNEFGNKITHNKVVPDKMNCKSESANNEINEKYTNSGINSHFKKLSAVHMSGESGVNNERTVKSGDASRRNREGDEYDIPDEDDDETIPNDKVKRLEGLKRWKASERGRYDESKKPKILENPKLTEKCLSIDIDDETNSNEDDFTPESVKSNSWKVKCLQNGENYGGTSDDGADSEKVETVYTIEDRDTGEVSKEITRNSEKRKSDSEHSEDNIDSDVGLKKLKFAALTSFPTYKTKDAPKLLFKPSSIQTIMSGPAKDETTNSNPPDEKIDDEERPRNRTIGFKFPSAYGSVYTKLHNPFLIPNSSLRNTLNSENKKLESLNGNEAVIKDLKQLSKTFSAPKEQIIPSGKFSLVKHMLSLQNEDNFDKTIFENPLYNKPADIKDFELMVERHRVTDKTDDTIVQSYDLSAKQNIPFHWLGMRVNKRKASTDSDGEEKKKWTGSTSGYKTDQNITDIDEKTIDTGIKGDNDLSVTSAKDAKKEKCVTASDAIENVEESKHAHKVQSDSQIQVSRGYQAMKNLVANRKLVDKSEGQLQWNAGKSILANPFDYENTYFQDHPDKDVNNRSAGSFLKVHNDTSDSPNMVRLSQTNVVGTSSTQNDNHSFHRNRELDLSLTNRTVNARNELVRQHSMDTNPESLICASSSFITKNNIQIPHSRTFSESHISREPETSICPISRSLSIPYTQDISNTIHQQRLWGSDSSLISKNRRQTTSTTASVSSHTPTYNSHRYSEMSAQSLSSERKFDNRSSGGRDGFLNKSLAEIASRTTPEKQIDLTMISKNLAQLQKLRNDRLNDIIDTESVFRHDNSSPGSSPQVNNVNSSFVKSSHRGCSLKIPNAQFNKIIGKERDSSEVDMFDAYNMVDSPIRNDIHQRSTVGDHVSQSIDSQTRRKTISHSHEFGLVGKKRLSVNNGTQQRVNVNSSTRERVNVNCGTQERVNVNCGTQERVCVYNDTQERVYVNNRINQRVCSNSGTRQRACVNNGKAQAMINALEKSKHAENIKARNVCQGSEIKTQVSIFDLLKGQVDKRIEYDNVDSLLGAYM